MKKIFIICAIGMTLFGCQANGNNENIESSNKNSITNVNEVRKYYKSADGLNVINDISYEKLTSEQKENWSETEEPVYLYKVEKEGETFEIYSLEKEQTLYIYKVKNSTGFDYFVYNTKLNVGDPCPADPKKEILEVQEVIVTPVVAE